MKQLMLGNAAVARGLYEAGCCVISSYPGTPSTEITEEAAKTHPRKNFITRALGVRYDESGEYEELDLEAGDRLMLCTDGLTNEVSKERIGELLELPAEESLQSLIRAALQGGGADNITVVLMDID